MTARVLWRTDDPCPVCGTALHATDDSDGSLPVYQECRLCGWSATWQAVLNLDGDAR